MVADLSIPTVDWRGKIVVFTSAPTAAVNTWELYGPDPDVLDFVATGEGVGAKNQKIKIWKPIAGAAADAGVDLINDARINDLNADPRVGDRFRSQAWRARG